MKKYLLLGLVLVVLSVFGARVWFASSADDVAVKPTEIASWLKDAQNNLFEAKEKSFYVQEVIGSQEIVLDYPQHLRGNFELSFEMMSLTQEAEIHFGFQKEKDVYDVEMRVSAVANKLRFSKNKQLLLEKDIVLVAPDVFYTYAFSRVGNLFQFRIDGQEVLKLEMDNLPVALQLRIVGGLDNPAAVEIMDFKTRIMAI